MRSSGRVDVDLRDVPQDPLLRNRKLSRQLPQLWKLYKSNTLSFALYRCERPLGEV